MKEPVLAYLPRKMDSISMRDLVLAAGGAYDTHSIPNQGTVSAGKDHAWIFIDDSEIANIAENGDGVLGSIKAVLGTDPSSCVVIEPSRSQGSNAAVRKFLECLLKEGAVAICGSPLTGSLSVFDARKMDLDGWLETLI